MNIETACYIESAARHFLVKVNYGDYSSCKECVKHYIEYIKKEWKEIYGT